MQLLVASGRDLLAIFGDGLRILARSWPTLLALFLLGSIGRLGVIWLAVWLSASNSTLAVLLVPLAPLATLLSLVLMLRVCGESLPSFAALFEPARTRDRLRSHLAVAAQVLIPFLAVYASQGLLKEDVISFVRDNTLDEAMSHFLRANYGRSLIAEGWMLVVIVVVAMVLRKVIAGYDLVARNSFWAALGGYVEALWMVTLSASFTAQLDEIAAWLSTRRIFAGVVEWWDAGRAWVEGASAWIRVPVEFVGGVLTGMGDLVILPVAWLAIGATIYGSRLAKEEAPPTHEEETKRIERILHPVRKAAAHVVEPVVTPVKDTWKAIKKVAAAGIVPMVVFCVVFATTSQLKVGVAWIARQFLGPQEALWQLAITPYLVLLERAVYLVVTVAMLAAAVHTVVAAQAAAEVPGEADPAVQTPGAADQGTAEAGRSAAGETATQVTG